MKNESYSREIGQYIPKLSESPIREILVIGGTIIILNMDSIASGIGPSSAAGIGVLGAIAAGYGIGKY